MYADIIPLSNSFDTKALTYSVGDIFDKKISAWCLVTIPVGKKEDKGIVVALGTDSSHTWWGQIREITALESQIPIINDSQIKICTLLSKKYCLPIHKVLQIFLPRPLVRRLEKYDFPLEQNNKKPKKNKKHLASITTQTIVQKKHIEPYLSPGTVIVVPDTLFLLQLQDKIDNEGVGFFSDDMTDTKKAQFWIDTYNKKYPIIIWTRRILYYNLQRYSQIVYLEDAFGSTYYHYPIHIQYLDILAYISSFCDVDITLLTSLPKLTTLSNFRHFTWNNI